MRRPLIGIAIAVALGTKLGLMFDACYTVWVGAAAFAIFSVILHFLHCGWAADITLHILIVLLTWWNSAYSCDHKIKAIIEQHGINKEGLAEIEGRIASDITNADSAGARHMIRFSMRVKNMRVGDIQYAVDDVVQVLMYGTEHCPLVYGQSCRMKGRLCQPSYTTTFGQPRYKLKTGFHYYHHMKKPVYSWWVWGQEVRRRTADMLTKGVAQYTDVTGVVHAMMLGYRSHLPDDVRKCFRQTGTMHVFAISGLHVGVLCTIIVFVLSIMGIPRSMWVLALAPLVCGYAIVTGGRASAIRAGIMAVSFLLAPLLKRKGDAVSAFAFAAAVILLWNPQQLLDVGFIYSFAVVAGIMAIVPIFDVVIASLWKPDDLDISETERKFRWPQSAALWGMRMFSVSLAAWLTSTPLSLHFFGRLSLVALLGNMIAIPLSFLIIVTGCLSVFAGTMISVVGEIFNCANWSFVTLLISGMQLLEKIPYGWIDCGHLPLRGVFAWYAILIIIVLWARRRLLNQGNTQRKTDHLGRSVGKTA